MPQGFLQLNCTCVPAVGSCLPLPFPPSEATHVSAMSCLQLKPGVTPGSCSCSCQSPSPLQVGGDGYSACPRLWRGSGKARGNKQRSCACHTCPLSQHAVIEGQADHGFLVATVFPLDLSCLHTPQSGQVIRGGCNRVKKRVAYILP